MPTAAASGVDTRMVLGCTRRLSRQIFQGDFPGRVSREGFQGGFPGRDSKETFQGGFPGRVSLESLPGKSPEKVSLGKVSLESLPLLFWSREGFQGEFPAPRETCQKAKERFQQGQVWFPGSVWEISRWHSVAKASQLAAPLKTLLSKSCWTCC